MAEILTHHIGITLYVASEDELLDFCNRVREAGGAEVLEALLPSEPQNEFSCLVANALNFGCSITPNGEIAHSEHTDTHYDTWIMSLPHNLTDEQCEKIAKAVGSEVKQPTEEDIEAAEYDNLPMPEAYVVLPEEIGNAAKAFDLGMAFEEYARYGEDI